MILKPIDNTFNLPTQTSETVPSDVFKYIANFNSFEFFETDNQGVIHNEIKKYIFICDVLKLATPEYVNNRASERTKFDGIVFIGIPADFSIDINSATFEDGQFENIIRQLISKAFTDLLLSYVNCVYEFRINSIAPLYNSNKYTKSTNSTGVEMNYSIWI